MLRFAPTGMATKSRGFDGKFCPYVWGRLGAEYSTGQQCAYISIHTSICLQRTTTEGAVVAGRDSGEAR